MKKNKLLIITGMCVVLLNACESKVGERQAEGFKGKTTTEFKVKAQEDLDHRIDQLQNYVNNVKQLIGTAQTAIKTENLISMSLFDVIYQVNSKIQNQMLLLQDENVSAYGQFEIATSLLDDQCQKFQYRVFAESVLPLTELKYSMQSCSSNDYLEVIKIKFHNFGATVELNNQNIKQVIPPNVLQTKTTECSFSSIISQATTCKDIMFAQSPNLVWFADLSSQGITSISIRALSKKTNTLIYEGIIQLSIDGKITSMFLNGPFSAEDN